MKCSATRRDGQQCRADARPGREHCFAHDGDLQAKATEARRTGGLNSSNAARIARHAPKDLKALVKTLLEAVGQVHRGELDPKRATAMASLASAAVRVWEGGEVEARLEALESRASAEAPRSRRQ